MMNLLLTLLLLVGGVAWLPKEERECLSNARALQANFSSDLAVLPTATAGLRSKPLLERYVVVVIKEKLTSI